jgi:rhodanese-related sulfurtransferase
MITTIPANDFADLIKKQDDILVLDIRTDIERNSVCLTYPSAHIPLHNLGLEKIAEVRQDNTKPLYVLCKAGPRAQKAYEFMEAHGLDNLVVVEGGITGCAECLADLKQSDQPVTPADIQNAIQQSVQEFMMKNTAG